MESNKEKHPISRKKFLQTLGSVVAGGSILGITGILLYRKYCAPTNLTAKTGCSNCKLDCPLRKKIRI